MLNLPVSVGVKVAVIVADPAPATVTAPVEEFTLATDVLEVVPRVALGSLAGVRIWFPDPWAKQRQRHRRLVRSDVLEAMVDRVRPGGFVHVATDVDDYVEQVVAVAADEPRLSGGRIDRPTWRPVTRFEARGLRDGRVATDLWFTQIGRAHV